MCEYFSPGCCLKFQDYFNPTDRTVPKGCGWRATRCSEDPGKLSLPSGLMSIPTHRVTRYVTSATRQWQPAEWRSCHRASSRQVTCVLRSDCSTDTGCSDRHRDSSSGPVSHSLSQNATVSRSKAYLFLCFLGSLHFLYLSTLRSQLIPVWAVSGMSKRPDIWVRQKWGWKAAFILDFTPISSSLLPSL